MNMKSFVIEANMQYQEYLADDEMIHKFYEIKNETVDITAVPDACVDIHFIKSINGWKAFACGSHLAGESSGVGKYYHCFGVKFHPGSVPACIKDKMKNLPKQKISLSDLPLFKELEKNLNETKDFQERIAVFTAHFPCEEQKVILNQQVVKAAKRIREQYGKINMVELANELGYNSKYLNHMFREAMGMPLKKYAVIMRVQRAIEYVEAGKMNEVYERLGYYDQARFIKEFKFYTSMTPAGYMRVRDKKKIV